MHSTPLQHSPHPRALHSRRATARNASLASVALGVPVLSAEPPTVTLSVAAGPSPPPPVPPPPASPPSPPPHLLVDVTDGHPPPDFGISVLHETLYQLSFHGSHQAIAVMMMVMMVMMVMEMVMVV